MTKGTKEWADTNINIQLGCENDCRYCYAKGMGKRYNRCSDDSWKHPIIREEDIDKKIKKYHGRVMIPTSHDITPNNMNYMFYIIQQLVVLDNNLLITTKPNPIVMKAFVDCASKWEWSLRNNILFRFTITSIDLERSLYWERNAPTPIERFWCLKFIYENGWKTSVSIEPYLDSEPQHLITILCPYVTDTIWIGVMNPLYIPKDDGWMKRIYERDWLEKIIPECEKRANGKLRLKDSIRKIMEK